PQLRAAERMLGAMTMFDSVDIEIAGFEIDLLPTQRHQFRRAQAMAIHHHNDGRISHPMAAGFACRLYHCLHLVRAKIVSPRWVLFLFPGRPRWACEMGLCRKRTLARWR